jgi:hypothetical protein
MMAKVSDVSPSAAVRSALDLDTLTQYENLRHQALVSAQEDPPTFQGLDVAFIEHQGLAAWVEGPSENAVPKDGWTPERREAVAAPPELVSALVDLVLGDQKEVQDGRAN